MSAPGDPPEDGDGPGDAAAVWLLALRQTLGFAALYYIFGALIVPFEQGLGWSKAALSLGPTGSLIVSAAAAPFMGRLVDRGHGATLLWGGALFGGAVLAAISASGSLGAWVALWSLLGLAHAAALYDVCFAFLTRRLGSAARPAIIRVTLMGGFASAIAFPLGASVAALWGWRGAVLVFAGLQIFVTAPANWYAGRRLRRRARPGARAPDPETGALRAALRRQEFWLLLGIFALSWMNHSVLVTYFIPVFTALGASPALAVAAASTVGPFQFAGRLLLMLNQSRASPMFVNGLSVLGLAVASGVLIAAQVEVLLIFLFAALQGASIGLLSILRPVLSAEVLGRRGFGTITGVIAVGPLLATAAAPLIGASLLGWGGALALLSGSLAMGLVAVALAALLRARVGR